MERFENSMGMMMQRIPAGSFLMGGGTYDDPPALPVHTVTITEDYVEKKGGPLIEMRGVAALPEQEANA